VLSFRPFAPEDGDAELFKQITRALHENRVLEFEYRNRGAGRFQRREVEPRHLACIDNHWYLFAFDRKRQAMRTFAWPACAPPDSPAAGSGGRALRAQGLPGWQPGGLQRSG